MIIRITSYTEGKKSLIEIRSKPRHQRGEHEVEYDGVADLKLLEKLKGRQKVYFHAHLKEDQLVVDDEVEGQNW